MKKIIHIGNRLTHLSSHLSRYATVTEALSSEEAKKSRQIELHLHTGYIKDNITIDKPLTIIGDAKNKDDTVLMASIMNSKGFALTIRNVTIQGSPDYKIMQSGGTLDIDNVTIRNATHEFLSACITLDKGVIAEIARLSVIGMSIPVISVRGEGTISVLSSVNIENNTVWPDLVANSSMIAGGIIDVSENATLLIEDSMIQNNEYVSIFVHDEGKMHLRNTTVTGTKSVITPTGSVGGINIAITSGATAELNNFISSYGQLAGIILNQAYLTAENGRLDNNLIGLSVHNLPQDYDLSSCVDISFSNNETKLDADILPVPSLSPDPSTCRRIPWN